MARVKMLTLMCGPEQSAGPGELVEVSAEEAQDLIRGGYAEPAETATESKPVETATSADAATGEKPSAPDSAGEEKGKRRRRK